MELKKINYKHHTMKKGLLPLLLAGLMASCADNAPTINNGDQDLQGGQYTPGEVSGYLSIKMKSPGGTSSRADADGQYEYGTQTENYVKQVRFYFFWEGSDETKKAGTPCPIRQNPIYGATGNTAPEYLSYYDWAPTASENQNGQLGTPGDTFEGNGEEGTTFEKELTTMVVLTAKEGATPTQIVAVLNPTQKILSLVNPSLSELQDVMEDYCYGDGLTSQGGFVMSSSVYMAKGGSDDANQYVIAQDIKENNIQATIPEAAEPENALTVYVERVVARLNTKLGSNIKNGTGQDAQTITPTTVNGKTLYPTSFTFTPADRDFSENPSAVEPVATPIYVNFLGWAVVSNPMKSYLYKSVNPGWDTYIFGEDEPWFIEPYHRSFWAINPIFNNNDYLGFTWYNYNEIACLTEDEEGNALDLNPNCFPVYGSNAKTQTYMQENANPAATQYNNATAANPVEPTRVVYAAQLTDADGTPITVTEWNGLYFTWDGLTEHVVDMTSMFYNAGTTETPVWKPLTSDEVDFMTQCQFNEKAYQNNSSYSESNSSIQAGLTYNQSTSDDAVLGNYWAYPTLTQTALQKTWYHKVSTEEDKYVQITDVPAYMEAVFGHAKIWNNGMTYYFYTINHLGAEEGKAGYHGVVRNHIYNGTINVLNGLGTPVWDPSEDIYPEYPGHDGNNISAKVEILMWRLVTQDVEFDW